MNKKLLGRLVSNIDSVLNQKAKRLEITAAKMNENYDWFFRHMAVEHFVLNLEISHLGKLKAEITGCELCEVEEIIGSNLHYYHEKLVSDAVTASTNIPMWNLAYLHERTVSQHMYRTLKNLVRIMDISGQDTSIHTF